MASSNPGKRPFEGGENETEADESPKRPKADQETLSDSSSNSSSSDEESSSESSSGMFLNILVYHLQI